MLKGLLAVLVFGLAVAGCDFYEGLKTDLSSFKLPRFVRMVADPQPLPIEYAWSKEDHCVGESPEIKIGPVPAGTTMLDVEFVDLDNWHPDPAVGYNHGGGKVPYTGSGVVPRGTFSKEGNRYVGPCPHGQFGEVTNERYELRVIAVDKDYNGIARGSAIRTCCADILKN